MRSIETRKNNFRDSLVKTVQIMAKGGIKVTQMGANAFCEFDNKGKPVRINLPVIPDNATPEFITAMQGFMDHEVAHALFTDGKINNPDIGRDTYLRKRIRETKRYHHLLLFVRIGLRTGARTGAILNLTWDRVNFAQRNIEFPVPGAIETNKRSSVLGMGRYLPRALKAEMRRIEKRKGAGYDTCNHVIQFEGQPVKVIRKAFVTACQACEIEGVSPHTLRHTFATWAMRNSGTTGITLRDLAGAMAHSDIRTTQRYAKFMPEAHKDVIDAAAKK